ncbi:MAG: cyclic pyranopterin monophosphate synthase MoaC [Cytophagales bacterium]|nr:cyclic pyranopterin monophosphate synthase MoaC [Cytophagales bacterium]
MKSKLSHLDASGNPAMVNVGDKEITHRAAEAEGRVWLGAPIMALLVGEELQSRKGPVFQTAIVAGIMGAKKTPELIPLCHPVGLDDCALKISIDGEYAVIRSSVRVSARTGVEMEALTAVAVAALTIYDMCKSVSHEIRIESIQLMAKSGGKRDFTRQ